MGGHIAYYAGQACVRGESQVGRAWESGTDSGVPAHREVAQWGRRHSEPFGAAAAAYWCTQGSTCTVPFFSFCSPWVQGLSSFEL